MKAVVLGGSGALGLELVGQLLKNSVWTEVVTVGRHEVTMLAAYQEYNKEKLIQRVVNMDNMSVEAASAFHNAHTVFCALGTTRKAAGSAEQFRKVDLHYVKQAAETAKQAGVQQFSLCSAQGANANTWASDWAFAHALLYKKTKGQAEEAVKAQHFASAYIFRPGLLNRGDKARGVEQWASKFLNPMPVKVIATAMILEAQAGHAGLHVYEGQDITQPASRASAG